MTVRNFVAAMLTTVIANMVASTATADNDILIADFETETYAEWKVTGTAFGNDPAQGTLPSQMHVAEFTEQRLVNSFAGGDQSTGTLTSPAFKVERDYVTFLIGGGGHKGKTCVQLLVGDKVMRESTGPNTQSGGSESPEPAYWDVAELQGREAIIHIIDSATGGWGHINVDHIAQSDKKPATHDFERTFTVAKQYLLIPIQNGVPIIKVEVSVDGRAVRRYETELTTDPQQVDWYAYFTINKSQGQQATVTVSRSTGPAFALIRESDVIPVVENKHDESLRPQLHFPQRVGWINDPNGMTYLNGEWHLYFQHNPVGWGWGWGWGWGNITWGHAVSRDLIHWEQLPNALFPETMAKGGCFSGGAVIDRHNTAAWKQGNQDVLVAFLTDTGAGEAIAFSHDRGRTFTWYDGNPVIKHQGRDPKVIWHLYSDDDSPLNEEAKTLGDGRV